MKLTWVIAPLFLGVAFCQIQGQHKITVSVDGKPEREIHNLALTTGQSFTLNCTYICQDDDKTKCQYLEWRKSSRNRMSDFRVLTKKFESSYTVDGRHRIVSTLTYKANASMSGIYTCHVAGSWDKRIIIDWFEVISSSNVTLPTTVKELMINGEPFLKRSVNVTHSLTLLCNFTSTIPRNVQSIYWKYNGTVVKNTDNYRVVTNIATKVSTLQLVIKAPSPKIIGKYSCSIDFEVGSDTTQSRYVFSPPIIPNMKGDREFREKEGTTGYSIECKYKAFPNKNITVTWFKNKLDKPWSRRSGITVEMDPTTNTPIGGMSLLKFDKLEKDDRGIYFCRVATATESDTDGVFLRVIDPNAAIWPLIGIIIEVLVVVIIIVVYEINNRKKRRAKEQADADNNANLAAEGNEQPGRPDQTDSGQTRQRAVRA